MVKGPYPEIAIPITVRPPWYNTIWAWLIYIIATALIAKYTLSYHLKNLQREEKSKLDAKRQAEEQKIQEMKSKMLEAQLQNKNNELSLQTSALVKRNQAVQKAVG